MNHVIKVRELMWLSQARRHDFAAGGAKNHEGQIL